jgi:hypothetical protein
MQQLSLAKPLELLVLRHQQRLSLPLHQMQFAETGRQDTVPEKQQEVEEVGP